MTEAIIIKQFENRYRTENSRNIREELRMSLVNMAINIGTFKINLSVNRNLDVINKKNIKCEISNRMKDAILVKNDTLLQYSMYNFLR
ncbi:MAG: hypothetical protein N4A50_04705 [Vallitalea sp.]|jgi:homoaconitase/3-isopropylmalate dehydratase large subunit|nr:hypothetical protein [Vallitalea sp.]